MKGLLSVLVILCSVASSSAQKSVVKASPTYKDRFPKKIGHLLLSKTGIAFPMMYDNETRSDTILFYNQSEKPMTLSPGQAASHLTVQISSDKIEPFSEGWLSIRYSSAGKKDYGFVIDRITIITNDSIIPNKHISVSATIEPFFGPMSQEDSLKAPRIRLDETKFSYGSIHSGDTVRHSFSVYNEGKKDLKILSVKTTCGCLKAIAEKEMISPGENARIQVVFNSTGLSGTDSRKIIIYCNAPFSSKQEMEITGEIIK